MGVLDEGRKVPGGGTDPSKSGKQTGNTVDIAEARTQVEANNYITKQLVEQGLTRGSEDYTKASQKAWTENNIGSLPEK
jgi:hypothetical protein